MQTPDPAAADVQPSALRAEERHRFRVDSESLAALGRVAPWRLLAWTLIEWATIVAAAWLASRSEHVAPVAVAVLFIATRQHALLILMHEFSHRQFSRTRPWLNDGVGDILTAIPFMITVHGFRRDHARHHLNTSTADDPNWVSSMRQARYLFPKSRGKILCELALHACGYYTLREMKGYVVDAKMSVDLPFGTKLRQWLGGAAAAGLVTYFHLWIDIALYWLLPMFTGLMALLYVRDIAEHMAFPKPGVWASRTVLAGPLERYLLAPHNVNFHTEHHLFPAVPEHRLAKLHARLVEDPTYRQDAVLTQGYLTGLMAEATASAALRANPTPSCVQS